MVTRGVKNQGLSRVGEREQDAPHAEHVVTGAMRRVELAIQMHHGPFEHRALRVRHVDQRDTIKSRQLADERETMTELALRGRQDVDREAPAERNGLQRRRLPVQADRDQRRGQGDAEERRDRHADRRATRSRGHDAHTARPLAERRPELFRQHAHPRGLKSFARAGKQRGLF